MASDPRRGIAFSFVLTGFVVGALGTYFLIVAPEQSFDFINTVNIKLILIITCDLLILFVGLFIYNRIDAPSPRKVLYRIMRTIIGVGTALTGAPIGVAAIIKQLKILHSDDVSFQNVTYTAVVIFISMILLLWLFYREYRNLAEYELTLKDGFLP